MKRNFILAISFALLSNLGLAQDEIKPNQAKIDSLENLLNNLEDEEMRVMVLNEFARFCFYNNQAAKGIASLREARILSDELNYMEGQRQYLLTLSIFHMTNDMSAYYQRKAEWISSRTDKEPPTSDRYAPDNSPDQNQLKARIEAMDSLLKIVSPQEVELRANILTFIGYAYYLLSDLEKSIESLSGAVSLFIEADELTPVILVSGYRMNMLRTLKRENEVKEIELFLVDLVANNKNTNRLYYITSAMGDTYANSGRYALAIEYYLKSLEEAERAGDYDLLANIQLDLGTSYESLGLNNKAAEHYLKGIEAIEKVADSTFLSYARGVIVFPLIALGEYEEAKKYMNMVIRDTTNLSMDDNMKRYYRARYLDANGQLLMGQGNYRAAIPYFARAFDDFKQISGFDWARPYIKLYLTECYLNTRDYTKALANGQECFEMTDDPRVRIKVTLLLSEIYKAMGNLQLAYEYLNTHVDIKAESEKLDEINRIADAEIRSIIEKSQTQINELEQARAKNEQESKIQRLWIISIAGALISAILISLILYRNNRTKQKVNKKLEQQKTDLQAAMDKLSATQSQLIHSEKMASLGELTAGIAHEIQNPLNFVNNFSEVNKELIEDLQEAITKNDQQEVKALLADLLANEDKVTHHGRRAEQIVKSMLQHSRGSGGEKEPTNINALCDEYLRLAYHGFRAKDKSFNADFELAADESMPNINVVPQDIGRVLLNLINNAFQAVAEIDNPQVVLTTTFTSSSGQGDGGSVEIRVADNGRGIPDDIRDKIFQPFFTTKPTGEGTGLGLSMSYDIITKGHNGEINLQTSPGTGTTFIIKLPLGEP